MRTSESIKELATALAKAQAVMEGAKKDANNPFFKSKYADLASVVAALKPHLGPNGLSYVQFPCTNDKDEVGVETMLMHSSGEWICADKPFYVPVSKADAQGFGSAITYARRYGLQAATGVAPEDDDGNAAATAKPLPKAIPANAEGHDIFSNYDAATKDWLRTHAAALEALHEAGRNADMVGYVRKEEFDTETKLALWTLLPSRVRSAYKKADMETRSLAEQG